MDITTVSALFTLFSGEQDTETYTPVITAAIDEVAQELRPDASAEDARLNYLAAAVTDFAIRRSAAHGKGRSRPSPERSAVSAIMSSRPILHGSSCIPTRSSARIC